MRTGGVLSDELGKLSLLFNSAFDALHQTLTLSLAPHRGKPNHHRQRATARGEGRLPPEAAAVSVKSPADVEADRVAREAVAARYAADAGRRAAARARAERGGGGGGGGGLLSPPPGGGGGGNGSGAAAQLEGVRGRMRAARDYGMRASREYRERMASASPRKGGGGGGGDGTPGKQQPRKGADQDDAEQRLQAVGEQQHQREQGGERGLSCTSPSVEAAAAAAEAAAALPSEPPAPAPRTDTAPDDGRRPASRAAATAAAGAAAVAAARPLVRPPSPPRADAVAWPHWGPVPPPLAPLPPPVIVAEPSDGGSRAAAADGSWGQPQQRQRRRPGAPSVIEGPSGSAAAAGSGALLPDRDELARLAERARAARLELPPLCACGHGVPPLDPGYPAACCANCPLRRAPAQWAALLRCALEGAGLLGGGGGGRGSGGGGERRRGQHPQRRL